MAKGVWQGSITDAAGNVIPGASVRFEDADTLALASTWSDRAGASPTGNPVVDDDGDGFVRVYLTKGRYRVTATSPGQQRIWEQVVVWDDTASTPPARTEATATLAAGDNDDFTPDGWESSLDGTGFLILEAGAGAANLTGLPPGAADQVVTAYNADTTNAVTLVPEDLGSTAAWRLAGLALTLMPGMTCHLHYVASLGRWVIV
jgi:hypothetical protein